MNSNNHFKRPQCLVLDALNTLIGLNPDYVGFFTLISRQGGIDPTPEVVAEALTHEYAAVRRHLVGKTDFSTNPEQERVFWREIDKGIFLRLGFDESRAGEMADVAYHEFESGRHFYLLPRTMEALTRIHDMGIPMGVISNGTQGMDRWMRECAFAPLMDFILVSAVVGWEKPGPEIFQMALEYAGVAPDEALYAGDSYEHDVLGAQRVGIRAVCVKPRIPPSDEDCIVLADIGELPEFIDALQE